MNSQSYSIAQIKQETVDTYILRLTPLEGSVFPFVAGQFARIDNPTYVGQSKRAHFFSIASSPNKKDHLEFCFKVYGEWTRQLSEKKEGDMLTITGPFGKFTWNVAEQNVVFLAGGVGITPFISMLRFIQQENQTPHITLLYGSRTEDQIVHRSKIENIISALPGSKVVHILSDVTDQDTWRGYRGFLTKEILQKEIDFAKNPTFFLCGPQIFVKLSENLLKELNVEDSKIKREVFSGS